LKLKEKVEISPTLVNLIYDDAKVVLELFLLVSNMKGNFGDVEVFHILLKKYDVKKTHIMLHLTLDPRFKKPSFNIILYWLRKKVVIVERYVKKSLYSMLIKCHNHLHLVLECEVDCAYPIVEKYYNLNLF
jgi:hypothetical protein